MLSSDEDNRSAQTSNGKYNNTKNAAYKNCKFLPNNVWKSA